MNVKRCKKYILILLLDKPPIRWYTIITRTNKEENAMTDKMISRLIDMGCRRLTDGKYDRLYIDSTVLGLKIERDGYGNISGATFQGKRFNSCDAAIFADIEVSINLTNDEIETRPNSRHPYAATVNASYDLERVALRLVEAVGGNNMAELIGTPKQILWAATLRHQFNQEVNEYLRRMNSCRTTNMRLGYVKQANNNQITIDRIERLRTEILSTISDSGWWIDSRGDNVEGRFWYYENNVKPEYSDPRYIDEGREMCEAYFGM